MMIVVPLGRTERLSTVLAMWRSQTRAARLVLVSKHSLTNAGEALVVRGPGSAGGNRNAGVEFARSSGEEWVVFWDDDNYYGPRYLEDFEAAMPDADVISRGFGFVRAGAHLWHFGRRPGLFLGHSTAVRVAMAPDFPDISGGEEYPWSCALGGARVSWLSPWHLVYDRTEREHAYPAPWAVFHRAFGPATDLGVCLDSFVDSPRDFERRPICASDEDVFAALERRAIAVV